MVVCKTVAVNLFVCMDVGVHLKMDYLSSLG